MTSTNPFSGFTFMGTVIVVILLLVFIRSKVVTVMLGFFLLAYLLINSKKIMPMLFTKQTLNTSGALRNI